jgi:hypothetical protein
MSQLGQNAKDSARIDVFPLRPRTRISLNAIGTSHLSLAPPHGQRVTSVARCPYASSLLLDALDPDRTEAGVFAADVCFKLLLFVFECLDRVDIGKL